MRYFLRVILTATAGLSLTAANVALACEGKTVIFEDNFQDDTGGWDVVNSASFEKSGMMIKMADDATLVKDLNAGFFIKDADICLNTSFPTTAPEVGPAVGLLFGAKDYANLFLYMAFMTGKAGLFRLDNNQWTTIVNQDSSAVKKNPGDSNVLRLTLRGGLASMYVNGAKLRDIRVQVPTTDSRFGVYAQRDKPANGQVFVFKNMKITTTD